MKLSEKPSLAEWQSFIGEFIHDRHLETDPDRVFVRFVEEVGELAKEMRKRDKLGVDAVSKDAAGELADCFHFLCDLSNHFGVDLETAVREKMKENAGRQWKF